MPDVAAGRRRHDTPPAARYTAGVRTLTPTLDRMVRAVEKVRERAERTGGTLASAGIPYAVIGGNAVAYHVAAVDEAAVRNTRDVDVLLDRDDLDAAVTAMEAAGFRFRHVRGIYCFLDGPDSKFRDAVHLLYAGEKVRVEDPLPAPTLDETEPGETFRVLTLPALVRMKLVAHRDRDRTHLRDLIELGLIDDSWPARYLPVLGERLQALLDDPDG